MIKCTLDWKCPRLLKTGMCCKECGIGDTCSDACYNNPGECLMAREATDREIMARYGGKNVQKKSDFDRIMETGKPKGIFWYRSGHGRRCTYFLAIDNRDGNPVMSERYGTMDNMFRWIAGRLTDAWRRQEC